MLAAFLNLDKPLGSRLVRPFFLAGSAFAALLGLLGMILGLTVMVQSPLLGMILLLLGLFSGLAAFLAVRVLAEAATILFRADERAAAR